MESQQFSRRSFLKMIGAAGAVCLLPPLWPKAAFAADGGVRLDFVGRSAYGAWEGIMKLSSAHWQAGQTVQADIELTLGAAAWEGLRSEGRKVEELLALLTSERCFDGDGRLRLAAADRMSTLLTPSGLAIEGGDSNAISRHTGSRHKNPVDLLLTASSSGAEPAGDGRRLRWSGKFTLPNDLPGGIYRLRLDFGAAGDKRRWSLNGQGFGARQRNDDEMTSLFSPPLPCDGGGIVGGKIAPRVPWVLLWRYNSNGYQGVVSEEDRAQFALSSRNIIQDDVILPRFDGRGQLIAYSLEPSFATDLVDRQRNIPWDYAQGEIEVEVTAPSGGKTNLGRFAFREAAKNGWPTTGNPKLTAWKPDEYGQYVVRVNGWIADQWGNRYAGGGTYRFWIANRLTMATATFQGLSLPVGSRYGKDMAFNPPVPATVRVEVDLYPDSDVSQKQSSRYSGTATAGGMFGAAQGLQPFLLSRPGEYFARVQAEYRDPDGHLWLSSLSHGGIVYAENRAIEACGKKLRTPDGLAERGETKKEGFVEVDDGFRNLEHINFPYSSGDVLLIASEGQGANKIEPALTYRRKSDPTPYDAKLSAIGASNLRIETTNGLSPHLYPEFIATRAYYYAAAPRPGFSGRFLVGEDGVRAPYWPTSATNFGGQIGASSNGDQAGDIYRLLGGVVVRPAGQKADYAPYQASAFILPGGSRNNRVIAAGDEDLVGPSGGKARYYLVPLRPGTVYEQGASFLPFLQIDPLLPAEVQYELHYPDGSVKRTTGTGDANGYFFAKERWPLEQTGVYRYRVKSSWQGHVGVVPGLPEDGGYVFVVAKGQSAKALQLPLQLKRQQYFSPENGYDIVGSSSAAEVQYALIMPGAIIEQGTLPVQNGGFVYPLRPQEIHRRMPLYDIVNRRNGKPEIGRMLHLTLFSREADGTQRFARVVARGAMLYYIPM